MNLIDRFKTADKTFSIDARTLSAELMNSHMDDPVYGIKQLAEAYTDWSIRVNPHKYSNILKKEACMEMDLACATMDFFEKKKLDLAISGALKGLNDEEMNMAYMKLEQRVMRCSKILYPHMGHGYRRTTFQRMTGYEYKNLSPNIYDKNTNLNLKDIRMDLALDGIGRYFCKH